MAGVGLHASRSLLQARDAMRGDVRHIPPAIAISDSDGAYARLRLTLWTGTDDRIVAPVNAAVLARQFAHLLCIESEAEIEQRQGAEVAHWRDASGRARIGLWSIAKLGHAWSGGSFRGSYTSPSGPRASDEMMAFFLGAARG